MDAGAARSDEPAIGSGGLAAPSANGHVNASCRRDTAAATRGVPPRLRTQATPPNIEPRAGRAAGRMKLNAAPLNAPPVRTMLVPRMSNDTRVKTAGYVPTTARTPRIALASPASACIPAEPEAISPARISLPDRQP